MEFPKIKITVSEICRRLCFLLIPVWIAFCFTLFALQYYFPSSYSSDLLLHIDIGKTGKNCYSIVYICLALLDSLPFPGMFIALFLTFFMVLGIWAVKKMLEILMPNEDKWIIWLSALICNMVFPIFIMSISTFIMKGYLNFNVYHNPTYIAMKPFAILSVVCFYKIQNSYTKRCISLKEWLSFSLVMLISALCKPSFVFGFLLSLLIVLIADFIKCKGKGIKNFVAVGTTAFPTAAVLLYQQAVLFDTESKIGIGFMTALNAAVKHPVLKIIGSLIFPLVIVSLFYKDIIKDKAYGFAWLNMGVSLFIMCCFYEQGDRLKHGNFFWSAYFFAGLLFIMSIYKFNQLIREKRVYPLVLSSVVLGIHFFCWLNYFMYILFSRFK